VLFEELTREESLELLARLRLGRLACARGNQPYVVPFYFAYDNNYLYSFSMVGQKIEWMRANPLVCVEAEEIVSPRQWTSVVIFGRYEELVESEADRARRNQPPHPLSRSISETPELPSTRDFAYRLLRQNAMWWEAGSVKPGGRNTELPPVPLYYRIHIVQITGHRSIPDSVVPRSLPIADSGENGWAHRILRQFRTKWK
jgi:nitroimidazol reductase NimA-like FMN-containing flavoprotein (pyridoxamine 5'-phosphate oxidase superfamily)